MKSSDQDALDEVVPFSPAHFFALQIDCLAIQGKAFTKKHLLPDLSFFYADPNFADVYIGWSREGIALRFVVETPFDEPTFPDLQKGDSIELFFDTRDVKTTGYTTRFCHHFYILPVPLAENGEAIQAGEVTRFRTEDVHELCDSSKIIVQAAQEKKKRVIDVLLPAECLYGYDPLQVNRMGFTYRLNRRDSRKQFFSASSEDFSIEQQPSLWASLKLVE